MDSVRELPYWPAAVALLIEAGQMTASDYVPTYPDLALASEGASTDAVHRPKLGRRFRSFIQKPTVTRRGFRAPPFLIRDGG